MVIVTANPKVSKANIIVKCSVVASESGKVQRNDGGEKYNKDRSAGADKIQYKNSSTKSRWWVRCHTDETGSCSVGRPPLHQCAAPMKRLQAPIPVPIAGTIRRKPGTNPV